MLRIIRRILIILAISATLGIGVVMVVNRLIRNPSGISLEGWSGLFTWLRHISSLGLMGVVAHVLPFVVITTIVVGIERFKAVSRK